MHLRLNYFCKTCALRIILNQDIEVVLEKYVLPRVPITNELIGEVHYYIWTHYYRLDHSPHS